MSVYNGAFACYYIIIGVGKQMSAEIKSADNGIQAHKATNNNK